QISVTPLEVATIAYTICSAFTYGLFLYKPQGASVVAMVAHCGTKLPESLSPVLEAELTTNRSSILHPIENGDIAADATPIAPGLNALILMLTSALFGAVHLAAWDSTFPTTIERSIWRAATLMTTVAFAIAYLPKWLWNYVSDAGVFGTRSGSGLIYDITLVGLTFIYALARLVLIVEMFRSLAYLPPDAFIATWTSNVPHVG
ncbi:hypothetical protein LTR95_005227, partial [Oleoguttula sp. CCFEE 5521]